MSGMKWLAEMIANAIVLMLMATVAILIGIVCLALVQGIARLALR